MLYSCYFQISQNQNDIINQIIFWFKLDWEHDVWGNIVRWSLLAPTCKLDCSKNPQRVKCSLV